jgi:hypothetical protein
MEEREAAALRVAAPVVACPEVELAELVAE